MPNARTFRVRDPVHGLIVFDGENKLDQLAWRLLNEWPFQRLRRIKQLGFSEFVFPGATHSRFSHCIGVLDTARQLVKIIARDRPAGRNDERAEVAILAALLHDIGHGAFSHVFEVVERSRGKRKKHEDWTAEIVLDTQLPIRALLDERRNGLARDIADLLRAETPIDVYHAVVSSSLDADRLDYLRRDRLMTGSGAGAIDFDWILDNLTVADINIGLETAEEDRAVERPSFCLKEKALQAAEAFLLARYHLYSQVYFHKTTRGIEQVLVALLKALSRSVKDGQVEATGLSNDEPIVVFYKEDAPSVASYLALDDVVLWSAVGRMRSAKDPFIAELAARLWARDLFKAVNVTVINTSVEAQRRAGKWIEAQAGSELGRHVLKDDPKIGVYGEIGADDEKVHKRLMILMADNKLREITEVSPVIKAISETRLLRYYFADKSLYDKVKNWMEGNHG